MDRFSEYRIMWILVFFDLPTDTKKDKRAYFDFRKNLQRDGFIETTVGRGSFVSAQNKDFYQEEQQRLAEEHLQEAADIGRTSGISLEKLIELLTMFYQEED